MPLPSIDWRRIRTTRGSQGGGFEELCCQLADCERQHPSTFTRKGAPDAGVECYVTLPDGNEHAWQAKYFDSLGDAQLKQLDDSVETALEKHPKLSRYVICLPLDLADPRVEEKRFAADRWAASARRWSESATTRGMSVAFELWGSYELTKRLSRPENAGRLRYWFDATVFGDAWFARRLSEALRAAGPRYSPEIHVDLPIAKTFDALGRTPALFAAIKAHAKQVRKELSSLAYSARDAARESTPSGAEPTDGGASLADVEKRLNEGTEAVLASLRALSYQPTGKLPLPQIAGVVAAAIKAAERLSDRLSEVESLERRRRTESAEPPSPWRSSPHANQRAYVYRLVASLRELADALTNAVAVAHAPVLVVTGRAGTGKTHLLCDVARTRLAAGRPTVLLMGQQFLTLDPPWTQALQNLDLAMISAEEFIGALEAAAQAADCRALILIDALNEGSGRQIWPAHLAAFLARIEKSPWIAAAVTVREAYEPLVIPEDIREAAPSVEHVGFADREFDAIKTFFDHYGLERPSAPLLLPEYRNPLFLKILCRSLHDRGETRVPRGMEGISATFGMYLAHANESLARSLTYNPKSDIVSRAIDVIIDAFAAAGKRWLPRADAEEMVNALLPGRAYDQSLYAGLVAEGILAEEMAWRESGGHAEVTIVGYERLSDHLFVKRLLDLHLDSKAPASAFATDGPLAYVAEPNHHLSPGLLEALCVQVPERTGRELAELAPGVLTHYAFASSFRESIAWRAPSAFSAATFSTIAHVVETDDELRDTIDTLLSLATIPGHPLNAEYLDKRLRKDPMPERDAWWSTSLHRLWQKTSSLDRLIDWAWSSDPADTIEDPTVDLCAITLAWLLTSSNRYLRDRATTALVQLLTGRLPAVCRLVSRFVDIDDAYVAERVVAVAYGCALRSSSKADVGALAEVVFERVFMVRPPRAHILLRDYARGVVERALHLGWRGKVNASLVRPPYGSAWPTIPADADVEKLKEDWTGVSYDGGQAEWSRNRIANSVMADDFARYVIGTNSGTTNFLSLRLGEPPWESAQDRLDKAIQTFSHEQKEIWASFEELDSAIRRLGFMAALESGLDAAANNKLNGVREAGWQTLAKTLNKTQRTAFETAYRALHGNGRDGPPEFDLGQIQRYVLARVFDLGWTTERFGAFDRFDVGYEGRDASKAERMGKKYQWIAYHEIMALVADNFQYREWSDHADSDRRYEGTWQDFLRDIDPSCTLRSVPDDEPAATKNLAWWSPYDMDEWDEALDLDAWVRATTDLPQVDRLLALTNPGDKSRWLNLDAYRSWQDQAPPDREPHEVARRNLWLMARAYLVKQGQADAFIKWAEGVDFMGRWMPEPPTVYRMFLGEHEWSPAARYFARPYYGESGWVTPKNCPAKVRVASLRYLRESSGFDCSIDSSFTLNLPCSDLMSALRCTWAGDDARFVDASGQMVAVDPSAESPGPGALLVMESGLRAVLEQKGLSICWAVLGERRILTSGYGSESWPARLNLSGAYRLSEHGLSGFLHGTLVEQSATRGKQHRSAVQVVSTVPKR